MWSNVILAKLVSPDSRTRPHLAREPGFSTVTLTGERRGWCLLALGGGLGDDLVEEELEEEGEEEEAVEGREDIPARFSGK